MGIKAGMHVSVRETGARGVVTSVDGESATIRLRAADKSLSAETLTLAVSGLKGEKGRPVRLDRLAETPAAAPESAPEAPASAE